MEKETKDFILGGITIIVWAVIINYIFFSEPEHSGTPKLEEKKTVMKESKSDDLPKLTPEEQKIKERMRELEEEAYYSTYSSSGGGEVCAIHGKYFPNKIKNEYGEIRNSGCTKCLYNDVNKELNRPGGFVDRVSNF